MHWNIKHINHNLFFFSFFTFSFSRGHCRGRKPWRTNLIKAKDNRNDFLIFFFSLRLKKNNGAPESDFKKPEILFKKKKRKKKNRFTVKKLCSRILKIVEREEKKKVIFDIRNVTRRWRLANISVIEGRV